MIFTNRSEHKLKEPFTKSDVIHPGDFKKVVDQYPGDVLPLFSQQEIRVKLKVLEMFAPIYRLITYIYFHRLGAKFRA